MRRRGKHFSQRGVALILVITALIIIGLVSGEFTANTAIDTYGTDDTRDQMTAEFLARSSMNLSEMILRLQQVLDSPQVQQQLGSVQITDYADLFMSAFGGTDQELADQGLVGDLAKSYGGEVGSFGVKISTDDGKINANCANGKPEYAQLTYTLIDSLYYFPAFDPIFQDPDADGWRRDRPTQTKAIVDYIDSDATQASPPGEPRSGAAEEYGYENLPDRYKAKNNYLDSVDELKLVRGVDDRFWTLFGPSFTVYGGCKLNVRALQDPRIIAAVIYLTAKDKNDPVLRDGGQLWYNALAASWASQNGYAFGSTQDFADFVKDPYGKLSETLAAAAGSGSGSGAPAPTGAAAAAAVSIPGIPAGTPLGIELDPASVGKVLRAGPRRTYRVEAWGETQRNQIFNQVRRTLTAVWDMGNVNSNQRSQDTKARNGAWVYLHEE